MDIDQKDPFFSKQKKTIRLYFKRNRNQERRLRTAGHNFGKWDQGRKEDIQYYPRKKRRITLRDQELISRIF